MDINKIGVNVTGIELALSYAQVCSLIHLCDEYSINSFIELGVYKGGMGSILIHRIAYVPMRYIGVDISESQIDRNLRIAINDTANCVHIIGDCLDIDGPTFECVVLLIKDTIIPNRVLFFCDNGLKREEIARYHSYLKSGDLLAIHDYGTEVLDEDLECLKDTFDELT